ncbi:hypothetical protein MKX03_012864 [Papaver bracteatum]|nr:hypothetical protein MKX03_012864 [Papaver bracteatum]
MQNRRQKEMCYNAQMEFAKSSLSILQVYGARLIRRWLEKRVVIELSKRLMRTLPCILMQV